MDCSSLKEDLIQRLSYHAVANQVLRTIIPTCQDAFAGLNWSTMSLLWKNTVIGFIDILDLNINEENLGRMVHYARAAGYCAVLWRSVACHEISSQR